MAKEEKQEAEEFGSIYRLEPLDSKEVRRELRSRNRKPVSLEDEYENKVWLVVYSLRPKYISVGKDPKILLPQKILHIRCGRNNPKGRVPRACPWVNG